MNTQTIQKKIDEYMETSKQVKNKIQEIIHYHKLDASRRYKDGSFQTAMQEYAEWYAGETLRILFKHYETIGDRVVIDLNKTKHLILPEHDSLS